jgi:hypothetical protein
MYPNIISNLYKKGEIEFSIPEYAELYITMIFNYKELRKDLNEKGKQILNIFLNSLYGLSLKSYTKIKVSNIHKVIEYYSGLYYKLIGDKRSNILYVNTDMFIFDKKEYLEIEKSLLQLSIPYDIDFSINAYFEDYYEYVIDKYGDLEIRGFGTGPKYGRDDIIEKMKTIRRKDKINKVISR